MLWFTGTQGWEYEYGVTCVEYTEFERLGVPDAAENGGRVSRYPANTNILYLGLQVCVCRGLTLDTGDC